MIFKPKFFVYRSLFVPIKKRKERAWKKKKMGIFARCAERGSGGAEVCFGSASDARELIK
jgi:hypothetical protein